MRLVVGEQGVASLPHPKVPVWVGDLVAAVLIVASAFIPFPETHFRPADAFGVVLVVAPALVLPLRRRWPIPVLAGCAALYGLAAFTVMLWPGIVLALAIAMFGVANRYPRRSTVITALAAIGFLAVVNLLAALGSVLEIRAFSIAVTVAFAAAAGAAARSGREHIEAITERAERAERTRESEARRRVSEERLKITRDLHDTVAHQIAVISLNAGVASSAIQSRPAAAQEAVRTIRVAARTVLGEIGALLEVLRTDDDQPGRTMSPQPGLDRLNDLVEQFADVGLTVTMRAESDPTLVEGATSLIAYRIIQEALTNAHKHGAEGRAHVLVAQDADALRIVVTNPVLAGDASRTAPTGDFARAGLGLIGLRERVAAVRGSVDAGPTPGGWRLGVNLPLPTEAAR